jgi:hypothetical protein
MAVVSTPDCVLRHLGDRPSERLGTREHLIHFVTAARVVSEREALRGMALQRDASIRGQPNPS